jgi:mono/diheme cytochrome c family protein
MHAVRATMVLVAMTFWVASGDASESFHPQIPKTWDDAEMRTVEIPLSHPEYSPKHVSAEFYYRMPVRPIYKSYPVYHPDREPAGYIEWVRQQEPREVWDRAKLRTKEDWISAGEMIFDAPIAYGGIAVGPLHSEQLYVRSRSWYEKVRPPLTKDGVMPFMRYVVRQKGKVEVGVLACALCHTRVLADGSILKGGPGNFPFDDAFAEAIETETTAVAENRRLLASLYAKPWSPSEFSSKLQLLDAKGLAQLLAGRPPGVMTRHRLSPEAPLEIPDLIGVEHRKYLDHTGLQLHRTIGDLMRYAALNQGGDDLANFGGFVPLGHFLGNQELKPDVGDRYSDEQLYALALFLYSRRPPANPNRPSEQTRRGEQIFVREGCAGCHTPPLYSNNKLTPAAGFRVPEDHWRRYDILPVVVGTDPQATMNTRRGTGYYKVPSLLGLWYRSPIGHGGWVATLEEWFDQNRLSHNYARAGYKGSHVTGSPVKGHEFGLRLGAEDKAALIAFLRTL